MNQHVKHAWPHLEAIRHLGVLGAELDHVRHLVTTALLHAGISDVTLDDEHDGREDRIRKNQRGGMRKAQADRIA